MTEDILDYPVTTGDLDDCIVKMRGWIDAGDQGRYFVCANPHSLEVARKDNLFEAAIRHADLTLPDGIGIILASKILGGSIRNRITGTDVFLEVSKALNREKRYSYFFLGSTEQNLMKIKKKLSQNFPNIRVAGTYSPPFKPEFSVEDSQRMIAAVNKAKPDVLWVGMTAPKQEKWIYQNKDRLNVKFIGAIGAVFDFYSGNAKRSHPAFQKMGLEWLPRLLRQPRRLWRRNFISNPQFLCRVIHFRITGNLKK